MKRQNFTERRNSNREILVLERALSDFSFQNYFSYVYLMQWINLKQKKEFNDKPRKCTRECKSHFEN